MVLDVDIPLRMEQNVLNTALKRKDWSPEERVMLVKVKTAVTHAQAIKATLIAIHLAKLPDNGKRATRFARRWMAYKC